MPLTDDQRAMLQLLLRDQSYADIGSLLGLDEDEVRSRARKALTEIGGEDPDRDVSLTDYLLGQADPIGRADAARHLQNDPGARELAEKLASQLRLLVPGADLPDLAGSGAAPTRRKEPAAPVAPSAETSDKGAEATTTGAARRPLGEAVSDLSQGQRQAIAGLIGAAVLVVVGLLAILGVFSGGGSSSSNTTTSPQASNSSGPPRANLTAQDGSKAQGVAVFARVRNVPVMLVNAVRLAPTSSGESYSVWLAGPNGVALPVGRARVAADGRLQVRLPIPTQALQTIGSGGLTNIAVTLVQDGPFKTAITQATRKRQLPRLLGKNVLSGPIVGGGLTGGASRSGSSG